MAKMYRWLPEVSMRTTFINTLQDDCDKTLTENVRATQHSKVARSRASHTSLTWDRHFREGGQHFPAFNVMAVFAQESTSGEQVDSRDAMSSNELQNP